MKLFRIFKSEGEPLAVSMAGIKLGDRLLVLGCGDPMLVAQLAVKTGLTGRAFAVDARADLTARRRTARAARRRTHRNRHRPVERAAARARDASTSPSSGMSFRGLRRPTGSRAQPRSTACSAPGAVASSSTPDRSPGSPAS